MKQIVLEAIQLENFKSFIKATRVMLSAGPGLKYFRGQNLVEPRLGANGAGKSTLIDALVWCFYGTGARGQKASELTSWGGKSPHVQVTLNVNGETIVIDRTGSPNRLSINTTAASQDQLGSILGLSKDRFLHSVVFGQDVPLFLDLSTGARGELLQTVLSLELWDNLSDDAGRQASLLGQQETALGQHLAFAQGKLTGLPDEATLRRSAAEWHSVHTSRIDDLIEKIEQTEEEITKLQISTKNSQRQLQVLPDVDKLELDIRSSQLCLQQIEDLEQKISWYKVNKTCPVCHQPTTTSHCDSYVSELMRKLDALPDETLENRILSRMAEQRAGAVVSNQQLSTTLQQAKVSIRAKTSQMDLLVGMVEKADQETNPFIPQLQELQTNRQEIQAMIRNFIANRMEIEGELLKVKYWVQGFRKIRLYQIKQVLLRLEIETANAASALGIPDWKIKYVTETENKSGTMKQGVQILLETPVYKGSWSGFSGGETQRIRLAVTLGLASMIQGMAGVNYNFEIFDESSQYLSVEGVDDLLVCLSNRADVTQKSIWVVDHTALSFGGFAEIWQVTKDQDGSRVALISQEY